VSALLEGKGSMQSVMDTFSGFGKVLLQLKSLPRTSAEGGVDTGGEKKGLYGLRV